MFQLHCPQGQHDRFQFIERGFNLSRGEEMLIPIRQTAVRIKQRPFVLQLVIELGQLMKIGQHQ